MVNVFRFELPVWTGRYDKGERFVSDEEKMLLAVELSRMNVQQRTGGPFGAAVFGEDGDLVSMGVNMVTTGGSSVLHAEVVAIMLAQARVGMYDLGKGEKGYDLFTSCEPCAMCLGAIVWAGLRKVVCGAREADAEAAGFDEGDKPSGWEAKFKHRGITVVRGVCRKSAGQVIKQYINSGGKVY
jgi:tRNA(Arg) A34 adenosine deaminase TadA